MLDYIRSSAQSFGVKVAFGIIILVFVFWGVGNFNDRDYSNVVAVVNGQPILAQEFEKAYQNTEEYILHNNPGMTRNQLIKDHLGRQVLRELIQATLVAQEAQRTGIKVSPVEMRMAVNQINAFQNENGKFDPDKYKAVLAARRQSPAQYEKELEDQLLREKIYSLVTAPVWIDDKEAQNRYNFIRERRIIDYIFISAEKFIAEMKITDDEIKKWYDAHLDDFSIPPALDIEYIAISPESLIDIETIAESEARSWYENNQNSFVEEEQVKVSHILVPVPEDASEDDLKSAQEKIDNIKKELDSDNSFASIADKYNEKNAAGPGGEIGWIKKGQTVPAFEDAAFSLQPGKVSEVVRTPFGLHLILVEEKKPGGVKKFEEVQGEIYKNIAAEKGSEKIHDVLDALIEDNILLKPLSDSAVKYGLKASRTGLLDDAQLMNELGISPDGIAALFNVPSGSPLDTALEAGDKYIVARVVDSRPESKKPLADVEEEIRTAIAKEKALAESKVKAADILKRVSTEKFEQVKKEYSDLKESEPMNRDSSVADFLPNPQLNFAIFDTAPGKWLPEVYEENNTQKSGWLIGRVAKVLPPESDEFESVADIMKNGVRRERMDAIYALFIQNLADKAKIEITNQNLIDRVNK